MMVEDKNSEDHQSNLNSSSRGPRWFVPNLLNFGLLMALEGKFQLLTGILPLWTMNVCTIFSISTVNVKIF